jgi:hypothetical protein
MVNIPNTMSDDNDPLDIIILCDYPILPGTLVYCKIIVGIHTEDENGGDHKIIAVLHLRTFLCPFGTGKVRGNCCLCHSNPPTLSAFSQVMRCAKV